MKILFSIIFCFLVYSGSVYSTNRIASESSEYQNQDLEDFFANVPELRSPENYHDDIYDDYLDDDSDDDDSDDDDSDDDDFSIHDSSELSTTTETNTIVPTTSQNTKADNLEDIKNLILNKVEEISEKFCTKLEAEEILSNLKSLETKILEKQKEIETKLEKITEEIVKQTESKFKKISEDLMKPVSEVEKYEYFKSNYAKNCYEALQMGNVQNGIYTIQPGDVSFEAKCDMETRGGGWTYVLNRFNGSQDFYLNWEDYKNGFGDLNGEFWLGLEHLYELTGSEDNELLVELQDWEDETAEAHYDNFRLANETQEYKITDLGEYTGTAGDSLSSHVGYSFATKDRDNWVGGCAAGFEGAWWYHNCWNSHLTGIYYTGQEAFHTGGKGMGWYSYRGWNVSLKRAKMMIRPKTALLTQMYLL